MARYLIKPAFINTRGSIGGATFQRCGRVLAIRKRNVPVQKKTPKQTASTNRLGAFSSRWKNLSLANKTTWSTFTTDYPRVDSFGITYLVKPQALRIGANISQFPNGASIINTLVAAITFVPIFATGFNLLKSTSALSIIISPINIQANCKAVFFAGLPREGRGAISIESLKRLGIIDSGNSSGGKNWFPEFTELYPANLQVIGFQIPIIINIIQKSSGQVIGSLSGHAEIFA
jgi:hypothetical protein